VKDIEQKEIITFHLDIRKDKKDVVYARFLLNGMKIARVTITFISSQSQAKHMKFRHIMLVTTTIRHHLQQQK
jgi:hypothetical protein